VEIFEMFDPKDNKVPYSLIQFAHFKILDQASYSEQNSKSCCTSTIFDVKKMPANGTEDIEGGIRDSHTNSAKLQSRNAKSCARRS
jgi:hypothetical protein